MQRNSVRVVGCAAECFVLGVRAWAAAEGAPRGSGRQNMTTQVYYEDFAYGSGGWASWGIWPLDADEAPPPSGNPGAGSLELELKGDGGFVSRSPWWVDYNHAPPGQPAYPGVRVKGSYLHLLAGLVTAPPSAGATFGDATEGTPNRFMAGGFPTDFTNAVVTVRVRGQLEARGSRLGLLAQARSVRQSTASQALNVNSVMPFPYAITPVWQEMSITLRPDDGLWQCLGSRVDRLAGHPNNINPAVAYGSGPASELLANLTGNIILVLFDLDVRPAPGESVPESEWHTLRAGLDYKVDQDKLPAGSIEIDWVRIEFPPKEAIDAAKL